MTNPVHSNPTAQVNPTIGEQQFDGVIHGMSQQALQQMIPPPPPSTAAKTEAAVSAVTFHRSPRLDDPNSDVLLHQRVAVPSQPPAGSILSLQPLLPYIARFLDFRDMTRFYSSHTCKQLQIEGSGIDHFNTAVQKQIQIRNTFQTPMFFSQIRPYQQYGQGILRNIRHMDLECCEDPITRKTVPITKKFIQDLRLNCPNLQSLSVAEQYITDYIIEKIVKEFPDLQRLSVRSLRVTDKSVETIAKLSRLTHLRLIESANITDLKPLASLTQLQHLDLTSCCAIKDITPIASLLQLTYLKLTNWQGLQNITALESLVQLTYLDLCGCTNLQNITALESLVQLTYLDLSLCPNLQNITVLASLVQLKVLELIGCTGIGDLETLASLPNLNIIRGWKRLKNSHWGWRLALVNFDHDMDVQISKLHIRDHHSRSD